MRMQPGDLLPNLDITLTDSDAPVDLTDASSVAVVGTQGNAVLFTDTSPTIADPTAGVVTHVWQSGETDDVGRIFVHVLVTWPGSKPQTFPPYGELAVDVG